MRLILLLFLTGCTPFIGYQHVSDPRIGNDGRDLACGGGKVRKNRIEARAAWCEDLRGGGVVQVNIDYDFKDMK